jgi:hypothetical protein
MSIDTPSSTTQKRASWSEKLITWISIIASVLAVAIAQKSCGDSNEALRLSQAEFQARRSITLTGSIIFDTLRYYVAPQVDMRTAIVIGDTIFAPAVGVDTVQPVPGIYIPVTPEMHGSWITEVYTGLSLRPLQDGMLLQKVRARFPQSGFMKEQIVYSPDFILSVLPLVHALRSFLTVIDFKSPGFTAFARHGVTLPVMLEIDYIAEGELHSVIGIYEVAFDIQFDPVDPGPQSFTVIDSRALLYNQTVFDLTAARVVMDSIWNKSLGAIDSQMVSLHTESLRSLTNELSTAVWMLKRPAILLDGTLRVPINTVPIPVLKRVAEGKWHRMLQDAELHIEASYNVITKYNEMVTAIEVARSRGSNPQELLTLLDTLASARIVGIANASLSVFHLAKEYRIPATGVKFIPSFQGGWEELHLKNGGDSIVVRGSTLQECGRMVINALWDTIPRRETIHCTALPLDLRSAPLP